MRTAVRPLFHQTTALLHVLCVLVGPSLHIWHESSCGCGQHVHVAAESAVEHCHHGHCCHHDQSHSEESDSSEKPSGRPLHAPSHDPDHCPICQQFAQAQIAAPKVCVITLSTALPFERMPQDVIHPLLVAATVSCRGPPLS